VSGWPLPAAAPRRPSCSTAGSSTSLPYVSPGQSAGTARHAKAIEAAFGSVPVSKLSAQHLDRAYQAWLGQGRAARTVRQRHAIMSSALHQAQRWGLVTRAVRDLASPPAIHSRPQVATDPAVARRRAHPVGRYPPCLRSQIGPRVVSLTAGSTTDGVYRRARRGALGGADSGNVGRRWLRLDQLPKIPRNGTLFLPALNLTLDVSAVGARKGT
jgi:hypothetical protein